jgi:hypothetical protein
MSDAPVRRVWVAVMAEGQTLSPGDEVMIEQYGDDPPRVAFRHPFGTWGRPHDSEAR